MNSTEHVEHLHRCPCGREWLCGRADCSNTELCHDCEVERVSAWLEDRGFEPQRSLALTAKENF